MKCPLCNNDLQESYAPHETRPLYCVHCDKIWIAEPGDDKIIYNEDINIDRNSSNDIKITENIPEMREGTPVYVNCRENKFFLELGKIVARDHKYYRIQFRSQDQNVDGKCVWFPEHWVEPIPKELRG